MLSNYLKNKFFSEIDTGIMVEVGSAGPEFLSQSKPFRDIGWRCICVEPNPKFAQMHRDVGNEIYEYACSYEDKSDVDFYVVDFSIPNDVTFESFSSLGLEKLESLRDYDKKPNPFTIKVEVKKLDTILEEANVSKVDCVIIDVEGWEIEAMKGFTTSKYRPKIIVLECLHELEKYHEYMKSISYEFVKFDNTTGPNYVYFNSDY